MARLGGWYLQRKGAHSSASALAAPRPGRSVGPGQGGISPGQRPAEATAASVTLGWRLSVGVGWSPT